MSHAALQTFELTRESRRQESALRFIVAILLLQVFLMVVVGFSTLLASQSFAGFEYPWLAIFGLGMPFFYNRSRSDSLMRTITRLEVDHARGEIRYTKWTGTRAVVQFSDIRSVTHTPASDVSPSESISITLHSGRTLSVNPKHFNCSAATLLATLKRAATSPASSAASIA